MDRKDEEKKRNNETVEEKEEKKDEEEQGGRRDETWLSNFTSHLDIKRTHTKKREKKA